MQYLLLIIINRLKESLPQLCKNESFKIYCDIFQIDVLLLEDIYNPAHADTFQKLINRLYQSVNFVAPVMQLIKGNSCIAHLKDYTEEQITYITSTDIADTKLIACPGSGKTRSVIARIKFMIDHHLTEKENIYAITFSRFAAEDFHQRIKSLFPTYAATFCMKNFSTIDSLAKSFLLYVKSHKSQNVEILSIAFRNYLCQMGTDDIILLEKYKKITHLFVDEAQDLNQIQYDILMLMKQKLGTKIHLVGDPNQNIYQFRRSSDHFLLEFPGKEFQLTHNFRSTPQIINFFQGLRPNETGRIVCASGKTGPKVHIITQRSQIIHRKILNFIKEYKGDLSDIAIIAPTKGITSYDSVGLSVFFNLLKANNILFNKLYEESGNCDERKKNVGKIPGYINLLTYHGTKGLEFDVVFVMDFYQFFFNIMPTEEEHNTYRYLLYVACSRAKSQMFICTYLNMHDGYMNHWITRVNPSSYESELPLRIPRLSFRSPDKKQMVTAITELISMLPDESLDEIHDILQIEEIYSKRIFRDFSEIDRSGDETLFGIFCEELFYLQHYLAYHKHPRNLKLIEVILQKNFIVIDNDGDYKYLRHLVEVNHITWQQFDDIKHKLPEHIVKMINNNFDRSLELNENIICNNEFIKIIEYNLEDIRQTYQQYQNPDSYKYNYRKILYDFFYLIVVGYAYKINHYSYINNHGNDKAQILYNGLDMFEEMNKYATYNYICYEIEPKVNVKYIKNNINGEIDFIQRYSEIMEDGSERIISETICEIKCVKEISIKHYLQVILYNFCYYSDIFNNLSDNPCNLNHPVKNLYSNSFKIINFLTGMEYILKITIFPAEMFNILLKMTELGNLSFHNMNLIYDLETTDKIETNGPYTDKSIANNQLIGTYNHRGWITNNRQGYCITIIPEIIEISIKDYETEMPIINTLIRPSCLISHEVSTLTNITNEMLMNAPILNDVRRDLNLRLKNFVRTNLMAYNGKGFDDIIMRHDKMIDNDSVNFIDVMRIIPMHVSKKLSSMKLSAVHHEILNEELFGHRAMADVDSLIKIMKHLHVIF